MLLTIKMGNLELVKDHKYKVRILTRDPNSRRAKELATLPGVELLQGTFASESDLTKAFTGCDGAVSLSLTLTHTLLMKKKFCCPLPSPRPGKIFCFISHIRLIK